MHESAMNGRLANLTSTACMDIYGTNFVSQARNVLLVTRGASTSNSSMIKSYSWNSYDQIPYWWICGDSWDADPYTPPRSAVCTLAHAKATASDWTLDKLPISYCMVEMVEEQCRLSFSLSIMLIVIIANASKVCISTYILPI
jgi:hypothetical protein